MQSTVLAYPTEHGYVFEPNARDFGGKFLAALAPDEFDLSSQEQTSPCLRAQWLNPASLLPRKSILLLAGIFSRGIGNVAHRGSGAVWAAVAVHTARLTPSPEWIEERLLKLVDHFEGHLLHQHPESEFFRHAKLNLVSPVGQKNLLTTMALLRNDVRDRCASRSLPILIKMQGWPWSH